MGCYGVDSEVKRERKKEKARRRALERVLRMAEREGRVKECVVCQRPWEGERRKGFVPMPGVVEEDGIGGQWGVLKYCERGDDKEDWGALMGEYWGLRRSGRSEDAVDGVWRGA